MDDILLLPFGVGTHVVGPLQDFCRASGKPSLAWEWHFFRLLRGFSVYKLNESMTDRPHPTPKIGQIFKKRPPTHGRTSVGPRKNGCEVDFGRRGKYAHGHRIDELFKPNCPPGPPRPPRRPPRTPPREVLDKICNLSKKSWTERGRVAATCSPSPVAASRTERGTASFRLNGVL